MSPIATIAVYPGSFDPITLGHMDIAERAATVFDKVIIAVITNPSKNPLFSMDERMNLIRESLAHISNIEVDHFSGLLVDYLVKRQARVVVKGLRGTADFESELQMASMNHTMYPEVETFFLPTRHTYSYLSSSLVKEIYRYQGAVSNLVSPPVERALQMKFSN